MIRKPISVKYPSFFQKVSTLPKDPILGLAAAFQIDPRPDKVNLGIGAYRDTYGKPHVFQAVKDAERNIFLKGLNKEYQPITGSVNFCKLTAELIFDPSVVFTGAQTIGGSFALRLGGDFILKTLGMKSLAISTPSWPNHMQIFQASGLDILPLPYINEKNGLKFDSYLQAIQALPNQTAILLHGSCHNPTGLDPSLLQWEMLADVCQKKQLLPFFDIAYQGFGTSLEEDRQSLEIFTNKNIELLVAYSFSKNMGLYGERVGAFFVTLQDETLSQAVDSHIKRLIRSTYSSPPLHSARIVEEILSTPSLKASWIEELSSCKKRIDHMRAVFAEKLPLLSFIQEQKGMFAYTPLKGSIAERLRNDHALYIQEDGRLSLAGLTEHTIEKVTDAIKSAF